MVFRPTASGARRRGVSLVLIVVSLVALFGVLALSLEGGMLLTERRNAQATADAAAMAAAADFYWRHFENFGLDTGDNARNAALYAANKNGYTNDGTTNTVTVHIPPVTGDYILKRSYTEVVVEYKHVRAFSSIFGTETVPVRARAVSVGTPSAGEFGILVLDPDDKSAFNAGGGGNIRVERTPIVVNSSSMEGSIANGGSHIHAPSFELAGSWTTSGGGSFEGTIHTGVQPMEDPYKWLPPPDPNLLTLQQTKKVQLTSGTTILYPGLYQGGISASSSANVVMMPGIYYMQSGGFTFTGAGSLTANGVFIYVEPGNGNADGVNVSASGSITMSAMTTGIYAGILFFQDRTADVSANISGGSNMDMTGTFYFAGALLTVTGSGSFGNFGSQYVSRLLNVQGTGNVYINWDPDKVGKVRLITIVE